MGTGDDNSSSKPSKPASSTPEVLPMPSYPDWSSSMQAYYGGGATPPFFASNVASPTPHPYMWGAQHPMMSPYGAPVPYPAMYPPGAVYHHPNMVPPPNTVVPNIDEGKVANGKDRSSAKKPKASTSAAKPVANGKAASGSGNDGASQSGSDGSSDGSDDNANQQEYGANKKGSFEQMLADASAHGNNPGRSTVPVGGTNLNMGMDLWNPSSGAARPNSGIALPGAEPWVQDERELKRQKRKQSNRESARRSRLRKQTCLIGMLGTQDIVMVMAECEELQARVENLTADNQSLKEELQRLSDECEKLTSENSSIKEELMRICGPEAIANIEKSNPTDDGKI
ncbi:hypothetical protein ACFE04_000697 [Oxalis oulophora]